ncbi:MAG TPA: sigma-54 dependent transcriptional regulator [Longimicrobiales bacterium]
MRILIVDDERAIRFSLTELLSEAHEVKAAEHAPAALTLLEESAFDLVISDLSMPAMSGLQLLEEVRARHPDTVFVLMTAFGDERTAVGALKGGAYDYIPKPFDNDELLALVQRVHELLAVRAENDRLRRELADRFGELIGGAPAMREVYRIIERVAPTDATVLILGESGTGKELAARALHNHSKRSKGPFIALNCSALPAELIESELFGHMRGAFTGAERDRQGLFEAAQGGTLLLDEVGELPPAAQAKLLRALEERAVTPVGATAARQVDVRVLAATHRNLDEMTSSGAFREDLRYRLQVITLTLPPLRERREDIIPLAVHLIAELARRHDRPARQLSQAARAAIVAYPWPGNVRELRNALERAVVLADGQQIELSDLPAQIAQQGAALPAAEAVAGNVPFMQARERALDAFDRAYLTAALEKHAGNVSATARFLGVHRQSLQKMLKRLALD